MSQGRGDGHGAQRGPGSWSRPLAGAGRAVLSGSDGTVAAPAGAATRRRWRRSLRAGQRYLDQPYTSVQLLAVAGVCLLGMGVLMAASTTVSAATAANAAGSGGVWGQLIKEIGFVVVGVPVFVLAARLSPRAWRRLAYPLLGLALVALVAVLIPGIGVSVNQARRWIDLGPVQLQPSELAKIAMLLWGADLLCRKQAMGAVRRARQVLAPLIPGFVLVGALIMREPDLGTTLCLLLILLGLLWTFGLPLRFFGGVLALVAAAVTVLAVFERYRLERLTTFLHPCQYADTGGFQACESIYALASGGLFGVGLGNGTSKYAWVPNANTDFVFSVIGEELGLIGCVAVLALFALLAFAGIRVSRRSADP
ncbi:MAG: FtsW/RodA/SpoVE family cell cycle protein, partial [Actinomycetia bacterium]|nr:FtsW/RodA/SpoVE family cell cycle protein [Actinomycetes bacterium]